MIRKLRYSVNYSRVVQWREYLIAKVKLAVIHAFHGSCAKALEQKPLRFDVDSSSLVQQRFKVFSIIKTLVKRWQCFTSKVTSLFFSDCILIAFVTWVVEWNLIQKRQVWVKLVINRSDCIAWRHKVTFSDTFNKKKGRTSIVHSSLMNLFIFLSNLNVLIWDYKGKHLYEHKKEAP